MTGVRITNRRSAATTDGTSGGEECKQSHACASGDRPPGHHPRRLRLRKPTVTGAPVQRPSEHPRISGKPPSVPSHWCLGGHPAAGVVAGFVVPTMRRSEKPKTSASTCLGLANTNRSGIRGRWHRKGRVLNRTGMPERAKGGPGGPPQSCDRPARDESPRKGFVAARR